MLDVCDAVYTILNSERKPLHFKELARILKLQGFEAGGSQTIETAINARIGIEIQKASRMGLKARFIKLPGGMIGICQSTKPPCVSHDVAVSSPTPRDTSVVVENQGPRKKRRRGGRGRKNKSADSQGAPPLEAAARETAARQPASKETAAKEAASE